MSTPKTCNHHIPKRILLALELSESFIIEIERKIKTEAVSRHVASAIPELVENTSALSDLKSNT